MIKYKPLITYINESSNNIELKSKSHKGNRYFNMLKTGMFQHYDSPKGVLSELDRTNEERKRLVSKLSKADKKIYNEWLKTPEGIESLKLFNSYQLNESIEDVFNKEYSYLERIESELLDIIMNEEGISEKSFKLIDDTIDRIKSKREQCKMFVDDCESKNMRIATCANDIYDKYFNS